MGASDNLAVFSAWTDAENRHDLTHHGDYLHEDIEMHVAGGEVHIGIDSYVATLQALFTAVDGSRLSSTISSPPTTGS